MDKIRREENADYTKAKTDLTFGFPGVRKDLEVPRDHYGGGSDGSAALVQGTDFMNQSEMRKAHKKYLRASTKPRRATTRYWVFSAFRPLGAVKIV